MNFIRRFVLPGAGVMAIALLIAIASPRAVHAVTAALVQIVNTPTNAVPAVQAPAESQIYRNQCVHNIVAQTTPQCSFPAVPAGQTLFVETVSAWITPVNGVAVSEVEFFVYGQYAPIHLPMIQQSNNGNNTYASFVGAMGLRASFPAGYTPQCSAFLSTEATGGRLNCSVYGYLAPAQ